MIVRRRIMASAASLLLVPALAGCWQGADAATQTQGDSGNGSYAALGDLQVESLTVVAGNSGSGKAAVSAVIVNQGANADQLAGVSIGGSAAQIAGPAEIPAGQSLQIGTDRIVQVSADGVGAEAGEYVDVSLGFAQAGETTVKVLVVPPLGYYAPVAPAGTTPEPRPSATRAGSHE